MLERTVDKPEAVPSDPSSCMSCDRDESDSECMAACCRRGFAPDPPQGTGAAAASASTPATAPPLQPKSGRAPKPLPSWGYTQNRLWDSSVVFPAGASNRLALSNVEAAAKWDCRGKFCGDGGCLRAAGAMRLLLCRQEFERQVQTARNADARRQGLHNLLASAHNLEDKTKSRINFAYTDGSTRSSIQLCDKGIGLGVCSVSGSYFGGIRAGVSKGATLVEVSASLGSAEGGGKGNGDRDHREGLLDSWLRAYYGRHGEHDPVPGASRTEQFSAPSEPGDVVYDLYKNDLGDQALKKTKFKALLKVFKKAFVHDSGKSDHCHCDECNRLKQGIKMYRAFPDKRAEWEDELKDHKLTMSIERQEMDDAGARSILSPWEVLTIQVDAATQSNFMLPRVNGTKTKGAAAWTRLKQKLFGTFAFGAGSRIWLVPPCIKAGADLTITIVHIAVLAALAERGGILPQELHLQLDNTSGDNKNEAMVLYAAWLVQTGQALRVRLFFLPKGHTHILIDQLFGRITVGCRGKIIPAVPDLLRVIADQMARKKARKYSFKSAESLQHTWSWTKFLTSAGRHKIGGMNTAEFNFGGYHDILISADSNSQARFRCRQSSQSSFYEPQDQPQGALIWKDGPPLGLPSVAPFHLPQEWGRDAIVETVRLVEDRLKTQLSLSANFRLWGTTGSAHSPTCQHPQLTCVPIRFPHAPCGRRTPLLIVVHLSTLIGNPEMPRAVRLRTLPSAP